MSEAKTGQDLLFDALRTKGTAFTHAERRQFGLLGLLAYAEKTPDQQVAHCWNEFCTRR
ncbi:MAG TPA: NAD-dependent malic enzyme, partial [Mycobacterium sp.]|nr:NAD-dependent malic enzyme [Mycobacterium sp.]